MQEKNKNRRTGLSDFLRYLKGGMSGKEMNSIERELQKDPFAGEAMEGLSSLKGEDILRDVSKLKKQLKKRTAQKKRMLVYRIAASIAVLMMISTLYIFVSKNKTEKQLAVNSGQPEKLEITQTQPISVPVSAKTAAQKQLSSEKKKAVSSITSEVSTEKAITGGMRKDDSVNEIRKRSVRADFTLQPKASVSASKIDSRSLPEYQAKGKIVSSEDNLPVPGASVYVKGTTTGVVTDTGGNFKINMTDATHKTLVASYIGMESKEFEANADTTVRIKLDPSLSSLSEVVVTGYGVNRKESANEEANPAYTPPQPAGGRSGFDKYIQNNIHRPDSATAGQRAVVVLSFIVRANGTPDNIKIIRSPGKSFSDEAIRLIKSGPLWKPAKDNGKTIEDEVRLRIVFR